MEAISIDLPRDPVLGYLSYNNEEPIEIDGKIWPSIERYVIGKKFSGSSLEEKVRVSKSSTVVSKVTKTARRIEILPDGSISKREIYTSATPQDIDEIPILQKAIEAKFKKHEERFLKTYPLVFVSKTNPEYAKLLTVYRDSLYAGRLRETRTLLDLTSDIPSLKKYPRLIEVLENLVTKIKKIDHVKKLHPGLYDDALWNMAPKGKADKILNHIDMNRVVRTMPNQRELVSRSFDYISRKFPSKYNDPEIQELSRKMWATFRWQLLNYAKTKDKYHWKLKDSKISLRPTPRPYRKSKAKAPRLKSLVVRSEEYAKLFGGKDDYEEIVEKFEKMNPSKRDIQIEKLLAALPKEEPKKESKLELALGGDLDEDEDEDSEDDEDEDEDSSSEETPESEESEDQESSSKEKPQTEKIPEIGDSKKEEKIEKKEK